MSSSKVQEWDADKLERAAKHLKELDRSPNSRAAIELARREQDVEVARQATRGKEAEAHRADAQSQTERIRWEEQRKTIETKAHNEKAVVDYKIVRQRELLQQEDNLARKRDEDNRARSLEDERVKQALRRQAEEDIQADRRRSDEHRAKLERENMKARAIAEAEGRIKEQRENEDVLARQTRLRMEQDRVTRLEEIHATFRHLADGFSSFISSPAQIATAVAAITAVAAGVYGSRETARVAGRFVERRLGTPSLVRESSRLTSLWGFRQRLVRGVGFSAPEGHSLDDVVLAQETAARVASVATAVRSTRANAAPYRNLLFYGPPGTGKTMVAKRLARSSGMDYAIMSGGDVGPLGRDAVTELHKLFDWAGTSRRGLVLFIDEADAFLGSRSRSTLSEDQRNALNALLYRTGEASTRFMLVLATNRPGDLDRAVGDRMDETMLFALPDGPARRALVRQYFDLYVTQAGAQARAGPFGLFRRSAARISVHPAVDSAFLEGVADRLEGFSGREIAKLFVSVQGTVYGSGTSPTVTTGLIDAVVDVKLAEHDAKTHFGSSAYDFLSQTAGGGGAAAAAGRLGNASNTAASLPEPASVSVNAAHAEELEAGAQAEKLPAEQLR